MLKKQIWELLAEAFTLCDDMLQFTGKQRRYFRTLIYNLFEAIELIELETVPSGDTAVGFDGK